MNFVFKAVTVAYLQCLPCSA